MQEFQLKSGFHSERNMPWYW
jgi:hypothetical protein